MWEGPCSLNTYCAMVHWPPGVVLSTSLLIEGGLTYQSWGVGLGWCWSEDGVGRGSGRRGVLDQDGGHS